MFSNFDIVPKEYDILQNLWCLFLYTIIVIFYYRSNITNHIEWSKRHLRTGIVLFFLIFLFTLSEFTNHDFYGYYTLVKFGVLNDDAHLESTYRKIVAFVDRNYLWFRTIVWGAALCLFCIGAKAIKISRYHALFVLSAMFIDTFAYGRVSLAMTMVYTGYALFWCYFRKNIVICLIGLYIFLNANAFHRSIVLAMAIILLMTYVPINKKTIKIIIITVPLLAIGAKMLFSYILETGIGLNEDTTEAAIMYNGATRQNATIFGKIGYLFEYARFYIPAYIGIRALYFKKKEYMVSKISLIMFKSFLLLVFYGTCFFFFGIDNLIFSYRIMYMGMIPLCYALVEFYSKGAITIKEFKWSVWTGIASMLFYFTYGVYKLL